MAMLLKKPKNSCHSNVNEHIEGLKKIVLVGSPNVGKSVVFGNLTGKYMTVSNYPGTPYLILLSFFLVRASGDTIEYGVPRIPVHESYFRGLLLNKITPAVSML